MQQAELDIIRKPRTNFSSKVLRKVVPNMNVMNRVASISMNKLNIMSSLNLYCGPSDDKIVKIHTVQEIPKMHSMDPGMMDKFGALDLGGQGGDSSKNSSGGKGQMKAI